MATKVVTLENLQYYTRKVDAELETKVDKITGKGLSTNDYTTEEKNALAKVVQDVAGLTATGGQANVIETVKVNGTALTPEEKAVNIDLSAYALKSDISAALIWKGSKATYAELPAENNKQGDVWHVEEKSAEYAWDGTAWVELGSIVDLSAYSTTEQMNGAISAAVAPKADKTYVDTELAKKANADVTYTKTEVDTAISDAIKPLATTEALTNGLAGKADKTHSHAISEVTDLQKALDAKAVKTEVEEALALKAVKSEVNSALALKADADAVYTKEQTYTKTEIEGLVAGGIEAITNAEIDAMFTTSA